MSKTVYVTAGIDLDEIETRDLLDELKRRGDHQAAEDMESCMNLLRASLDELRNAIGQKRNADAMVLIDRIFAPRFKDTFDCRDKYKKAMEARTQ